MFLKMEKSIFSKVLPLSKKKDLILSKASLENKKCFFNGLSGNTL